MPKRTDLKKILIIGSGPIIISQACEFDYSGTQACKSLREEGYEVILINSNPATIMTDPETADRTYVEPITPEAVEKIIEGKLAKFYEDVCLMEQPFIKDTNMKIKDILTSMIAKIGENIIIRRFVRFQVGEE